MWSFNNRHCARSEAIQHWIAASLALLAMTLTTSCGFEPVYGHKTPASGSQALAGVKIDSIGGRMGQEFKSNLEDLLNPNGPPAKAAYRLNATLSENTGAIGVAPNGTVSRYNVYLDSAYTLYRTSDGKPITSGNVRHVSSYNNVSNAYFSTYSSEADAEKRGVIELAEIYRQRLGAYLSEGAPVEITAPAQPPGSETGPTLNLPGHIQAAPGPTLPPPPPPPATLLLPSQ